MQAISNIIAINEASLKYQELECHGHPYASRWYTWPVMEHPVLMYYQSAPLLDAPSYTGTGVITNMGNPVVWWLGILALLFCVWRMSAGPKWLRVGRGRADGGLADHHDHHLPRRRAAASMPSPAPSPAPSAR